MKQNFTGYKVPKTLNLRQIEVKFLKGIPGSLNTNDFYYLFYNETIRKWNIPQKCNGTDKDKAVLTKLQAYITNHYGYDRQQKQNVLAELLPLAKNIAQSEYIFSNIKELELKRRLKDKEQRDYERTKQQLENKFTVNHL
jgi:hypothetical protein